MSEAPLQYDRRVHRRIVFKEVCKSFHDEMMAGTAFNALSDIARALNLLRKAGYIHRDISSGNCLIYGSKGKLSDLEFCKPFGDPGSHDSFSGTTEFAAAEAIEQRLLFGRGRNRLLRVFQPHPLHDLEALNWLSWWFIYSRTLAESSSSLNKEVFNFWKSKLYLPLFNPSNDGHISLRRLEILHSTGTPSRTHLHILDDLAECGWTYDKLDIIQPVLEFTRSLLIEHEAIYQEPQETNSDGIARWPLKVFRKEPYDEYEGILSKAAESLERVELAHSNTTTTAPAVVGGANDSTPAAPVVVSGAPATAKKISSRASPSTRAIKRPLNRPLPLLLVLHHPVHPHQHAAQNHSPLHAHRAHQDSTHHASFQNLKPIFEAPSKPAPLPFKSKRFTPSPLSRFVSVPPPRCSYFHSSSPSYSDSKSDDDDSESEDDATGGYAHIMGPCLVGSFRPPPPKPRYHGHSRSSFGLTKWVWSTRLALCEGSGSSSPDSPVSPTSPDSPVSPKETGSPKEPVSPTSPVSPKEATSMSTPHSPTDALPYPLTTHPSFLHLRRARPALLEEEDNRPSEPPLTIYAHGWTLRKIVWACEVASAVAERSRSTTAEAESRSASESETEDEDEETKVVAKMVAKMVAKAVDVDVVEQGVGEVEALC
ncbi:hypothetical protein DFP72DRAFT_1108840 [Ephemerocybe angulata]|uniref:Fungal-type protein kinase domain-containing protein n=1 Tax=Ephemerocybe angulata TaxID=980116 RepID=A0A8H6MHP3_9AGAR|nr:hypothetical protein DFP72DRAFT_1108840 [Tulosesus angulatus]